MKFKMKGGFSAPKPRGGLAPAKHRPFKPRPQGGLGVPGGAPQPGAQPPPPSPQPSGLPPVPTLDDARFQSDTNALQRNFNDQDLALANRETGIRSDYGFDQAYANNPYTRAGLLQRAADQRRTASTNSFAARGQLYSGALDRQRGADEFGAGQQLDALRRSYSQNLAQVAQDRLQNQRTLQEGTDSARADMLDRFSSSEPDSSLYSPDEVGGGAGPAGGKNKSKGGSKASKSPAPKKRKFTARGGLAPAGFGGSVSKLKKGKK